MDRVANVLVIAGIDPIGGAGVVADVKTITANGAHPLVIPTALTSQNSKGVKDIFYPPIPFLESQIGSILDEFEIDAIKIGMIGNQDIIQVVIDLLDQVKTKVVIDPIMHASSGDELIKKELIKLIKDELFKRAHLITPNIPEAMILSGVDIDDLNSMREACINIDAPNILLKGGHLNSSNTIDLLYHQNEFYSYTHKKIRSSNIRGTGCTLSSAIAANLAHNRSLIHSCENSISYITKTIEKSYMISSDTRVPDHLSYIQEGFYV